MVPRPKHLSEMLEIARILSKPFPFVRVDFFENTQKVHLAELTFVAWGGMRPYEPESFDLEMGSWLKLP